MEVVETAFYFLTSRYSSKRTSGSAVDSRQRGVRLMRSEHAQRLQHAALAS